MKIYQENIKKYDAEVIKLQTILSRISFLRLFIFIISVGLIIYLLSHHLMTLFFIVLPISIVSFAIVIKYYDKIAYLKKHTTLLKKVNESELIRAASNLETLDSGDKFINQHHPYTSDLDIFGQHSIFQLVNRTTTESGMICLADWLSKPASNEEILERQEAIKELAQKLDWRQDFEASGMYFYNKKRDYYKLLDWVNKPTVLLKKQQQYLIATIILPILFLISFYTFIDKILSPDRYIYLLVMFVVLFINYMILRKLSDLAEEIVETSTANLSTLRGYQTLINRIEKERFESKKLNELQSKLIKGKYAASNEIVRICKLLDFSHQRPIAKIPLGGNYFYSILNSFLLLDIHLILGTEKWKIKNKAFLKSWAEAVSEFEVISSFAGFCYSNPSYTFPEVTEKENFVHFESLGHPLINSEQRICNDFHSENYGDIVVITGSNMGGKSTFLRSVGVNIVLALAGAPCCAKKAQVSNLKLFTSMRTQDNLMKGVSSFYAELNRIEQMLNLIKSNPDVYFLTDEMFKGTNSKDRHRGGFSLINQLSKLKTSGIIATHDIELAKLLEQKKLVKNYSFNSEIKDNAMIFSYKLHPAICHDFNASALMKNSGIEIIADISKSEVE
ncbi:MAG: DNA mismatch repair protein MutS [Saprospiraceae bacterium]